MDGRARVAFHLRRLRVERGLSQEALAVDAGVDRSYVSGLERGAFNPTVDVLDRLAAALGGDASAFLLAPDAGAPKPQPLRAGRKKA